MLILGQNTGFITFLVKPILKEKSDIKIRSCSYSTTHLLSLMTQTTALIAACFVTFIVNADITSAPHAKVAVSGMGHATTSHEPRLAPGDIIVRVQEHKPVKPSDANPPKQVAWFGGFAPFPRGERLTKPIVSVHRYNETLRAYKKLYEFEITSQELAEVIVPDQTGERLAFIYLDRTNAGLRVYSDKGRKSTYWPINQFLKERHREITPGTVTTVQWFHKGSFAGSRFKFYGPNQEYDLTYFAEHHPEEVEKIRTGFHFELLVEQGEFQEFELKKGAFKYTPVLQSKRSSSE